MGLTLYGNGGLGGLGWGGVVGGVCGGGGGGGGGCMRNPTRTLCIQLWPAGLRNVPPAR